MWCVPGGIRRRKREKGKEEGEGEVSKMEEVGEMFKTGLPFLYSLLSLFVPPLPKAEHFPLAFLEIVPRPRPQDK